jgi:3-dehydroquinate synthase
MESIGRKYGVVLLVLTRALPILAEATVLLMSVNRLPWSKFLTPVILSNLGIAVAYSIMGKYAAENEFLAVAMAISGALPVLLTSVVQGMLIKNKVETGEGQRNT